MKKIKNTIALILAGGILTVLSSCATVGVNFPSDNITDIEIGETNQTGIMDMYGYPWRKGIEDGYETWTYGYYRYQLFGQTSTKDLVVRFDKNGVVTSYSFNESTGKK